METSLACGLSQGRKRVPILAVFHDGEKRLHVCVQNRLDLFDGHTFIEVHDLRNIKTFGAVFTLVLFQSLCEGCRRQGHLVQLFNPFVALGTGLGDEAVCPLGYRRSSARSHAWRPVDPQMQLSVGLHDSHGICLPPHQNTMGEREPRIWAGLLEPNFHSYGGSCPVSYGILVGVGFYHR